jgi:hypothetical protein
LVNRFDFDNADRVLANVAPLVGEIKSAEDQDTS